VSAGKYVEILGFEVLGIWDVGCGVWDVDGLGLGMVLVGRGGSNILIGFVRGYGVGEVCSCDSLGFPWFG